MLPFNTKVYGIVNSEEDQKRLQDDTESMVAWSKKPQLPSHPDKAKVMHMGKPKIKREENSVPFAQTDLKTHDQTNLNQ